MLSKAQIKHIRSLAQQKYRLEYGQFIAEGDKIVREWLQSDGPVKMVIALEDWAAKNTGLLSRHPDADIYLVPDHVLSSVSQLQTPNSVLIVVEMENVPFGLPSSEWTLALEDIQDPGNMGTIIRIADWFGIRHIVRSAGCVDIYNPKVVQSAMGGHLRIQFHEADLQSFLPSVNMPVLAATLDGENIYTMPRFQAAVLLIGNESKGVSDSLQQFATSCITIPGKGGAESLNAAVSTGILCALLTTQ